MAQKKISFNLSWVLNPMGGILGDINYYNFLWKILVYFILFYFMLIIIIIIVIIILMFLVCLPLSASQAKLYFNHIAYF